MHADTVPGCVQVFPDDAPIPTVAQLVANSATGALSSGTLHVRDEALEFTMSSLPHESTFNLYMVARDTAVAKNTQLAVALVSFQTQPDATPPVFEGVLPRIVGVQDDRMEVQFQTNEPATVFIVVYSSWDEATLLPEDIIDAVNEGATTSSVWFGTISTSPGSLAVHSVEGLDPSQQYTVAAVARDTSDARNVQATVSIFKFSTLDDDTPPTFTVPGGPTVSETSDTTTTVTNLNLDEAGTVYVLIAPRGQRLPSFAEAVSGLLGSDRPAEWFGVVASSEGSTSASPPLLVEVSGVRPGVAYDAIIVAQDAHMPSNVQAEMLVLPFSTLPDATAPVVGAGYPRVDEIGERSFTLSVQLNEPGIVRGVATPRLGQSEGRRLFARSGHPRRLVGVGTSTLVFVIDVDQGGVASTTTVEGAVSNTTYDVALTISDKQAPTPNTLPHPLVLVVTTWVDRIPPAFLPGHPSVQLVAESSCTLSVAMSETGVVWGAVFRMATPLPDTTVMDWNDPSAWFASAGALTSVSAAVHYHAGQTEATTAGQRITLGNLQGSTEYRVLLIARDVAPLPNVQVSAEVVAIATLTGTRAGCLDNLPRPWRHAVVCGCLCAHQTLLHLTSLRTAQVWYP